MERVYDVIFWDGSHIYRSCEGAACSHGGDFKQHRCRSMVPAPFDHGIMIVVFQRLWEGGHGYYARGLQRFSEKGSV